MIKLFYFKLLILKQTNSLFIPDLDGFRNGTKYYFVFKLRFKLKTKIKLSGRLKY